MGMSNYAIIPRYHCLHNRLDKTRSHHKHDIIHVILTCIVHGILYRMLHSCGTPLNTFYENYYKLCSALVGILLSPAYSEHLFPRGILKLNVRNVHDLVICIKIIIFSFKSATFYHAIVYKQLSVFKK